MWRDAYVAEKVRELDPYGLAHIRPVELGKIRSRRLPVAGALLAPAGRSMRRVGEALELWATPANEREDLRVAFARARKSD